MKVSDVLAALRSKMRDDSINWSKQGDNYLISLIYFWQNQLLSEFSQNIKEIEVTLNSQDEIEMPFVILRLIAAYLNGNRLNLVSLLQIAQNLNTPNLCIFEKRAQIYGLTHKVSGKINIFAVKKAYLGDKNDEMSLSDDFLNLLVYSVFLDLMKSQISPENAAKINFFEQNVLNGERRRVVAMINRKNSLLSFNAPFIRA